MNEIMNVMKERRSIRKFKPDMPSKEDLNQIIEAGLYAASGMGKQAAIIVAVTNKELRDKLSEMNRRIGGWEKGFDPFMVHRQSLLCWLTKTVRPMCMTEVL